MKIGYARISTHDQTVALQRDALAAAEREEIFTDTVSGAKAARPGLEQALAFARARELYAARDMTVGEMCRLLGVSRSTFYGYVPIAASRHVLKTASGDNTVQR
jgi:DNA invertase Pin-like site-specific DNA recombinase